MLSEVVYSFTILRENQQAFVQFIYYCWSFDGLTQQKKKKQKKKEKPIKRLDAKKKQVKTKTNRFFFCVCGAVLNHRLIDCFVLLMVVAWKKMSSLPYVQQLSKVIVAQITQTIGWNSIQTTPLELLTDILHKYLEELTRQTQRYTELCKYRQQIGVWVDFVCLLI